MWIEDTQFFKYKFIFQQAILNNRSVRNGNRITTKTLNQRNGGQQTHRLLVMFKYSLRVRITISTIGTVPCGQQQTHIELDVALYLEVGVAHCLYNVISNVGLVRMNILSRMDKLPHK